MRFLTLIVSITLVISACKSNTTNSSAGFSNTTVEGAKKMIKNKPDLVIIDVRTPEEIAEGHIDGAIGIDVKADDFKEKVSILKKDKEYLVYCRSGRRSVIASQIMVDQGFKHVTNMEGGYLEWEE